MYVVCVQVHVKADQVEQFIQVTRDNFDHTRGDEPGNVRWDLLQSEENPTVFFIYEVYRAPEDFPIHQQTPHYLLWKETVADMMAEPRMGTRYHNIYPSTDTWK